MDNIIINEQLNFMNFKKLNEQNVTNLFTLIPYNFRKNIVSDNEIKENYNKIQNDINHQFIKIVKPIQTHTNIVKVLNENNINDEFNDVDGLITNMKNIALVTSLADCQGILLYDDNKKVIGNIHSGWKGTFDKIVENAIKLMIDEFGCNPKDIEAYITPSIMDCCFEVDEDVKNMFQNKFQDINIDELIKLGEIKDNKQKYYIDTIEINRRVMLNLGLNESNIISSNMCSKCNSNIIHSHRHEGINSGRNIALICLK